MISAYIYMCVLYIYVYIAYIDACIPKKSIAANYHPEKYPVQASQMSMLPANEAHIKTVQP